MRHKLLTITLTILLALSGAFGLLGAEATAQQEDSLAETTTRLSELLWYDLESPEGTDWGGIEDFIIDTATGQVRYAVLSLSNVAGLTNNLYPIPLSEMDYDTREEVFILNTSPEILSRYPGFVDNAWPNLTEAQWATPFETYWDINTGVSLGSDVRASEMLWYDLESPDGIDLGSVEDLTINLENAEVRQLVLSLDPSLGLVDELYPVPLDAVTVNHQRDSVIFNVGPDALSEAPGISDADWVILYDNTWDTGYNDYWDNLELSPAETALMGSGHPDFRLSELVWYHLRNMEGNSIGGMEDIIIDTSAGAVQYVVLSFVGSLGMEERFYPVPLSQLMFSRATETAQLTIRQDDLLQVPGFTGEWPDMSTPAWLTTYNDYWNVETVTTTGTSYRGAELLWYDLETPTGENLGAIEDIILNTRTGQVKYIVLSLTGPLAVTENFYPVPLGVVTIDRESKVVLFDPEAVDIEELPMMEPADWANLADPAWDAEIEAYWTE